MADSRIQTAIWAAKMVLFSMGIVSTFIFFKVAIIPCVFSFLNSLPTLWILFKNLLSPPYIYFILNLIILTIIIASSSSAFHSKNQIPTKKPLNTAGKSSNFSDFFLRGITGQQNEKYSVEVDVDVPLLETDSESEDSCVTDSEESNRTEKLTEVDGVEELEEIMSLDDTWRMIMEGQGKAKAKPVMKKCETWERRRNVAGGGDTAVVRRRERSINGEELKERAEAFIKRFTHEMRIQKQESDQRFLEMVSRGIMRN